MKPPRFTPVRPEQVKWKETQVVEPILFRGNRLYDVETFKAKPRGVHLEVFSTDEDPTRKPGLFRYKIWLGGGKKNNDPEVYLPIGASEHAYRSAEEAGIHATKALNWFLTREPQDMIDKGGVLDLLPFIPHPEKKYTVKQLMKHKQI